MLVERLLVNQPSDFSSKFLDAIFINLEITSMKSEFGHFIGFCIVMIITILVGIKASFLQAILILIVNIFFNFYPFILQRFHRLRLNELNSRFRVGMV
jgi:Glycosyl-4,4'-diaponeurosporenoate acyltransferase